MPPCPSCQQPASKRNGPDRRGKQKYTCRACRRAFTANTAPAFSAYRWPADVILTALRRYLAHPLSSRQVMKLLAERGIDVSHRTVLNRVQDSGRNRPPRSDIVGVPSAGAGRWMRCSYSARATSGISIEQSTKTAWSSTCCSRERRDTASAQAFFRQAIERTGVIPHAVVTDRHQASIKAVATACPGARHIRTGLHRAHGETTKAVERSHVPTRDRLRNSRGLKHPETGQRFLEGFEAVRHLRRGGAPGAGHLVPGRAPHARVRRVVAAIHALGHGLHRY